MPETARLRTLEDENRCLKKLLAESVMDNAVLKDLLSVALIWKHDAPIFATPISLRAGELYL